MKHPRKKYARSKEMQLLPDDAKLEFAYYIPPNGFVQPLILKRIDLKTVQVRDARMHLMLTLKTENHVSFRRRWKEVEDALSNICLAYFGAYVHEDLVPRGY